MDRETSLELLNLRELINLLSQHQMALVFHKGNIEVQQGTQFLMVDATVDQRCWAQYLISKIHNQLLK